MLAKYATDPALGYMQLVTYRAPLKPGGAGTERDHSPDCPGGAITRNFWINQAVEADPDMTKFVTCSS